MDPKGGSGSEGEAADPRGGSGSKGRHTHLHLALRNFFKSTEGDFAIPATPCSGTEGHHLPVFPISGYILGQ